MADGSNEILKEIALMEGITLEDSKEVETPTEELEVQDEQEGQEREQEEQASAETSEEVEKEEEEESIEQRYARLLEAHNALASQMMELKERGYGQRQVEAAPSPPAATQPAVAPSSPAPAVPTPLQFDDQLIERALVEDDPKALKQILVGLAEHVERLVLGNRESMVRELPVMTQHVARQQLILMKAVDNFYSENPDLLPHQAVVGMVANELVAKEPGLGMPEVLKRSEAEARKVLGLKKQVQKVEAAKGRSTPAFAPTKSARKPGAPKIENLRGEIGRMQDAKW